MRTPVVFPSRCPGQPARIRPAVGLGRYFPDPAAVPTDPDGLLAAVYQPVENPACAPIAVGDTIQDRAFMLIDGLLQGVLPAAALEGPGSSGWLRLEIILDRDTYRYLGARTVVTRDHLVPNGGGPRGTRFGKGQVLVSRAQLALAVVDAPCQRAGETTTCASYVETTWVGG
jgi:hypothetical protein